MNALISRVTTAVSTPFGFLCVNLAMVFGLLMRELGVLPDDPFTLALSIAAITLTVAVLVAQKRDTEAMHAKLDELIASIEQADDRKIGIEKEEVA